MLESYHEAIAFVIQRKVETPSPSNRVTIFAVGSVRDLKALAGGDNRFIAGFYVPRAGGSRAFIPDIRMKSGELDFSRSEENTSELQSLMRISYAVFCLKKKQKH